MRPERDETRQPRTRSKRPRPWQGWVRCHWPWRHKTLYEDRLFGRYRTEGEARQAVENAMRKHPRIYVAGWIKAQD